MSTQGPCPVPGLPAAGRSALGRAPLRSLAPDQLTESVLSRPPRGGGHRHGGSCVFLLLGDPGFLPWPLEAAPRGDTQDLRARSM